MNPLRRCPVPVVLALLAPFLFAGLRGAEPPTPKAGDTSEKWLVDRSLTVSPRAAPIPALRYRLYPLTSERKPGNAVPVCLRFAHERSDAAKKSLHDKPAQWNKLPLEKLPLAEAHKFLDKWKYNLRQLELGARFKTADWNYILDDGDPIGILLPDLQEMRLWGGVLALKVRVEMAEGKYTAAVRTLETGFSFSRQIGQSPFLIGDLVGIACAAPFINALLELVERTDAPNLYWALTTLPRPFIDLREGMDFEQRVTELQLPDLAHLDRLHTAEEWDAALVRVRKEVEKIMKWEKGAKDPKAGNAPGDPAAKSPDLPAAKKYLAEIAGYSAAAIDAMPAAEVLLRYLATYSRQLRDDQFKAYYVPYPEARPILAAAKARLKAAPDTEPVRLARLFLPAITKVQLAQVRINRQIAALRVIEALRLHAAANGGQLPAKLSEVTLAPVPLDPGTNKPFGYHRDGRTATLISRLPGEPLATTGLRYRITLRK